MRTRKTSSRCSPISSAGRFPLRRRARPWVPLSSCGPGSRSCARCRLQIGRGTVLKRLGLSRRLLTLPRLSSSNGYSHAKCINCKLARRFRFFKLGERSIASDSSMPRAVFPNPQQCPLAVVPHRYTTPDSYPYSLLTLDLLKSLLVPRPIRQL